MCERRDPNFHPTYQLRDLLVLLDDVTNRLSHVRPSPQIDEVLASVHQHRQMVARWLAHPPSRTVQSNAAANILSVIAAANSAAHAAHFDTGSWRPVQAELRAAQHSQPEAGTPLYFDLELEQGRGIARAILEGELVPTPLAWLPKAGSRRGCEVSVDGIDEPFVLIAECVGIETPDGVLLELAPASDRQRERLRALADGDEIETRSTSREELPTLTEDAIRADERRQLAADRARVACANTMLPDANLAAQLAAAQLDAAHSAAAHSAAAHSAAAHSAAAHSAAAHLASDEPDDEPRSDRPTVEQPAVSRRARALAQEMAAREDVTRDEPPRTHRTRDSQPIFDEPIFSEAVFDDAVGSGDGVIEELPTVDSSPEVSTVRPPPASPVDALLEQYCAELEERTGETYVGVEASPQSSLPFAPLPPTEPPPPMSDFAPFNTPPTLVRDELAMTSQPEKTTPPPPMVDAGPQTTPPPPHEARATTLVSPQHDDVPSQPKPIPAKKRPVAKTQELPEILFAKAPVGAFPHHSDETHIAAIPGAPALGAMAGDRHTPVPTVVAIEEARRAPRRRRRGGAVLLAASIALGLFASPTPHAPTADVARSFASPVATIAADVAADSAAERAKADATDMVTVKRTLLRKPRR